MIIIMNKLKLLRRSSSGRLKNNKDCMKRKRNAWKHKKLRMNKKQLSVELLKNNKGNSHCKKRQKKNKESKSFTKQNRHASNMKQKSC
jgi:hypothetical protein